MSSKIELRVSQELQNQIVWLCEQESALEWSGTLFYTMNTDDISDPNCIIYANYLVLQDIGTETFTTYDFGPEFIKTLMEKRELCTMKKGHIHSHNTMGVFFSTEDENALLESSEMHNNFLSLIVNNKNEMMARMAFKSTSELVERLSYLSSNGENLVKESSISLTEVCYYKCNVIKPGVSVDDQLRKDFSRIKEEKKKPLNLPKYNPHLPYVSTYKSGAKVNYEDVDYGNYYGAGDFGELPFPYEAKEPKEVKEVLPRANRSTFSKDTLSFAAKLVSTDSNYKGTIKDALEDVNRVTKTKELMEIYTTEVFNYIISLVEVEGAEYDKTLENLNDTINLLEDIRFIHYETITLEIIYQIKDVLSYGHSTT